MNSIKAIPVGSFAQEEWRVMLGKGESSTALEAYRTVAAVYRCVRVRAKAAKSIPLAVYRGAVDISDTPDGLYVLQRTRQLLYLVEASLCLYGRAHALKELGTYSQTPRLRWVASPGLIPQFDESVGVRGYRRRVGGVDSFLAPDRVWSCWLQSPAVDVGADIAPAEVALRAAGILDNLDSYLEGFFNGGAIRATLLRVKSAANEGEKKKLEAWWKKTLSGVKNAFTAAAISADVEPLVIGDSLSDTVSPEVRTQALMDVLIAMEVPASLVLANAANYATAVQDEHSFLSRVILPEVELILDSLNLQFYREQGLELVPLPERLAAFQQAELDRASAIQALTSGPVLTQTEARQLLGREPLTPPAEEAQRMELGARLQLAQQLVALGYTLERAAELLELAPPGGLDHSTPLRAPETLSDASGVILQEEEAELKRWERKALKRGGACSFESPWIDPWAATLIHERLGHSGGAPQQIRDAFKLGAPGASLTPAEQRIFDALEPLLQRWGARALDAVWSNEKWDAEGFSGALRGALIGELLGVALTTMEELGDLFGPEFDVASAASDWARTYTYDLVKGLTDTTQSVVSQAISAYFETPGMTRAQLQALLQGAFSPRRAESIAVTEVTRAASAATQWYQQQLLTAGLQFERVWRTVNEGSVCTVCDPLNGKPESAWIDRFPGGPPAHPRCRCSTTLRRVK